MVTFGVVTTSPETGYGYIKSEKNLFNKDIKSYKIKKFVEKPNLELAKMFINDESYTWNSGMFVFKTSSVLNEIIRYEPSIKNSCEKALNEGYKDLEFQRLDKKFFNSCKDSSFDVSIMEKTNKGIVLPLDVMWSDIGSWKSLWENESKDKAGYVVAGRGFTSEVKNSYIKSCLL